MIFREEGCTVTDEPLGSHVLELELTDVVEETTDARSLVSPSRTEPTSPPTGCATRRVSS